MKFIILVGFDFDRQWRPRHYNDTRPKETGTRVAKKKPAPNGYNCAASNGQGFANGNGQGLTIQAPDEENDEEDDRHDDDITYEYDTCPEQDSAPPTTKGTRSPKPTK